MPTTISGEKEKKAKNTNEHVRESIRTDLQAMGTRPLYQPRTPCSLYTLLRTSKGPLKWILSEPEKYECVSKAIAEIFSAFTRLSLQFNLDQIHRTRH